jgi:hypothetical protein
MIFSEPTMTTDQQANIFTREFDRRAWTALAVLAVSLLIGAALTLHAAWQTNIRVGYKPAQPIAFSHQLHAGSLEIRCRYCHTEVDRSAHAGIPPLSTCMNCHSLFEPDPNNKQQVERIGLLLDHWNEKRPVLWNKVYDLADFAYFDHSRHSAAGLDCRNCHGDVETMAEIEKVTPMTMGWCLTCHMGEAELAPSESSLLAEQKRPQIVDDPIFRKILAPIHCGTCHR